MYEIHKNEQYFFNDPASINAADYRLMKMGFTPKKKIFGTDITSSVASAGYFDRKPVGFPLLSLALNLTLRIADIKQ